MDIISNIVLPAIILLIAIAEIYLDRKNNNKSDLKFWLMVQSITPIFICLIVIFLCIFVDAGFQVVVELIRTPWICAAIIAFIITYIVTLFRFFSARK